LIVTNPATDRVAERLRRVRADVDAAVRAAGREAGSVVLVAVSKTHPVESIRAAYDAGQRDFGESYAQEFSAKRAALSGLPDLRWHFIGALQSNKAKLVVPGASLVHAVDRESVAAALSRKAREAGAMVDVLVEVNVGAESSKAGVAPEALETALGAFSQLEGVRLAGLMCIPPPLDARPDPRSAFATLRSLRDRFVDRHPALRLLSMGMSDDFAHAIAEGATHVRVGSAIFGERPRKPVPE